MAHFLSMAVERFGHLQGLLAHLGLQEATHKATPPTTPMIWLDLLFDSEAMAITLLPVKLLEVLDLVTAWSYRQTATLHDLQEHSSMLLRFASLPLSS